MVCATSKGSDQPAHERRLIRAFANHLNIFFTVSVQIEHHLDFLSLKEGCTRLSESTLVKIPHCWKPHAAAQLFIIIFKLSILRIHMGAQWLSGRVLDSRPRGRRFEPQRRHCVVILEQDTFILA